LFVYIDGGRKTGFLSGMSEAKGQSRVVVKVKIKNLKDLTWVEEI